MADFIVLEELSDIDPRLFFAQMSANGARARFVASKEFRDSEVGRILWYCKDWLFGAWESKWTENLQSALPERLRPRNKYDLLGGLVGDAKVEVMMAYLGVGGTRTPLHLDKAASIAYNCIVWSETPQSSKRWWIFHSEDLGKLNRHLGKESKENFLQEDVHWIDPADFDSIEGMQHETYSFEQVVGELVIVPPSAPHCVINQGQMTFACAANIIDAKVAMQSFLQSRINKKLLLKTVYKVAGAIWGTMMMCQLPDEAMGEIFEVCDLLLDYEKQGLHLIGDVPTTTDRRALEFINMVTCDYCQSDIFNAYLLYGDLTFCPEQDCVAHAKQMRKDASNKAFSLTKVIPIPLEKLRQELQWKRKTCGKMQKTGN
jgi:hypothetical protein